MYSCQLTLLRRGLWNLLLFNYVWWFHYLQKHSCKCLEGKLIYIPKTKFNIYTDLSFPLKDCWCNSISIKVRLVNVAMLVFLYICKGSLAEFIHHGFCTLWGRHLVLELNEMPLHSLALRGSLFVRVIWCAVVDFIDARVKISIKFYSV